MLSIKRILPLVLVVFASQGCCVPWTCGTGCGGPGYGGTRYIVGPAGHEGFFDPWFEFLDPWNIFCPWDSGYGYAPYGTGYGYTSPATTVYGYGGCVDPTYGSVAPQFSYPAGPMMMPGAIQSQNFPTGPGCSTCGPNQFSQGMPAPQTFAPGQPMFQGNPGVPMGSPTPMQQPVPMNTPGASGTPIPQPIVPPTRPPMSSPMSNGSPGNGSSGNAGQPSSVPPAALLAPESYPVRDTRNRTGWDPRRS